MTDDRRVQELLDQLIDPNATPEDVCAGCPELLPEVRSRWKRMRRLSVILDAIFPAPQDSSTSGPGDLQLPQIPGHEVEAVLGVGGMGVVFRARHLRLNRPVAVKMILAGPYARPAERQRFVREAEAVAGLSHPNVVQVHEAGEVSGRPYFTMELVDGGSLARKLADGPLPPRQAAELVSVLADAVHAAHRRGIVHRDLKPANVLLVSGGAVSGESPGDSPPLTTHHSPLTPKVTDFGLARRLDGDEGLTMTGVPVGTPCYMAPEQARGDKNGVGPAADVYALGAILYECLTGRPPFKAETATATLHQVIADDPVPPARLNPQVPRDLETICLTCLAKDPARRYPSAEALADDLRRFERGEPIVARPPGRLGRLVRWVRRRPAEASLLAAAVMAALAVAGAGGWLIGQRTQTARAVEADVREVVRLQQESALPESRAALERAHDRLGDDGPARLHSLVDQARQDQQLLERLDAIRTTRSTFAEGRENHAAEVHFNNAQADREYQKTFRDAGLGAPPDDPDGAAGRVKASAVRAPLVAALDDWAVCSSDAVRRDWVLRVARGADPDAWRDRVRDPAAWGDVAVLAELARTAPVAEQPLPLLLALGERLDLSGGDGVGLLRLVQEHHPDDFLTNFTLARALYDLSRQGKGDWDAAIPYYQKALELRPRAVAVQNDLGLVMNLVGWLEDNTNDRSGPGAITIFRKALRMDPDFAPAHNNLGLCLKRAGIWMVAVQEYQDALRADPTLAPAHFNLGEIEAGSSRINEAIDHYREALRIDPDFALAQHYLGIALLAKGRHDEVLENYPAGDESLNEYRGSAIKEANDYYYKAYDCDPNWVAARNGLRIPPRDAARLDEAIDHFRQAIRLDPRRCRPHGSLGQALLAKWQFAEADAAIGRSLELLAPQDAYLGGNLERLHQRCRQLMSLDGRLPAIVRGTDTPAAGDRLVVAELCYARKHYATAARLYAETLAADPRLTEDLLAGHRFNAACAAALAAFGRGDDATSFGERERKGLREQARGWLGQDLAACTARVQTGEPPDLVAVRKALATWRDDPALAGLRAADTLGRLPANERQAWERFWSDADALLRRASRPD